MGLIRRLSSSLTMYRLMQLYLLGLLGAGSVFSLTGVLPYDWWQIPAVAFVLAVLCLVFNRLLAKLFSTSAHDDSALITAMILALIFGPLELDRHLGLLVFLSATATASKYLLAYKKRHFFNPAAFAAVASGLILGESASWWTAGAHLLPLFAIGGILKSVKMRREKWLLRFCLRLRS